MARWTIRVSDETDRNLRSYLAQHGAKKGSISRFVEEVVQERLDRLTVEGVQASNAEMSDEAVEALIADAVRWARKGH